MICELKEEMLCGIYADGGINAVRRFVSGLIVRQICSNNSVIYRKYRRPASRELLAASQLYYLLDKTADSVNLWDVTI